jgi:hypothetical protein
LRIFIPFGPEGHADSLVSCGPIGNLIGNRPQGRGVHAALVRKLGGRAGGINWESTRSFEV